MERSGTHEGWGYIYLVDVVVNLVGDDNVCNDDDDDDDDDDEQVFAELFARLMLCLNLRGEDEEERENERDTAFLCSTLVLLAMTA